MPEAMDPEILRIYEEWHRTVTTQDLAGCMKLYAEDAVLETPSVLAMYPDREEGILRSRAEIEKLFSLNWSNLTKEFRELYRTGIFLANGQLLMWEYPRKTPGGSQVDLVESMDIENGLIKYHRVYWGWSGFKSLEAAREKRRKAVSS